LFQKQLFVALTITLVIAQASEQKEARYMQFTQLISPLISKILATQDHQNFLPVAANEDVVKAVDTALQVLAELISAVR